MSWIEAFALTLSIEIPVYLVCLMGITRAGWRTSLALCVIANAGSHPLLWFATLPALNSAMTASAAVLTAEAFVLVIEWVVAVAALRRDRAVLAATVLLANGLSFLGGMILQG